MRLINQSFNKPGYLSLPPIKAMFYPYLRRVEMLNGWQLEILDPEDIYNDPRHGTAWISGHPDTENRHVIGFNFIKCSATPELNIEEVCKATILNLNGIIEDVMTRNPRPNFFGEKMPRVHAINFWDQGLPGELLDLRLRCYLAHYEN